MSDQESGKRLLANEPSGQEHPSAPISTNARDEKQEPAANAPSEGLAHQGRLTGDQQSREAAKNHRLRRVWKWFTGSPSRKVLSALGAIILAAVSGVVGAAAPGWFASSSSATQAVVFDPWISPTRISNDIQVAVRVTGSCWEQSEASNRADAYRCMENNIIVDPCFANPWTVFGQASPSVACPFPKPNSITVIRLTGPLPQRISPAGTTSNVWLIVLPDGESCPLITAGTISPGGLRLNYQCPSGGLYGDPQRAGEIWKIFKLSNGTSDMTLVPIAQAYS